MEQFRPGRLAPSATASGASAAGDDGEPAGRASLAGFALDVDVEHHVVLMVPGREDLDGPSVLVEARTLQQKYGRRLRSRSRS
ncbi:hypothetical protein [Arthrobacter sp. L77]|uniref:hypothetical protein n=1 Tax=Arthrobacter sp. L77 TaxID=1496689 RepID=UPI000AE71311|nr:hypothetical protein [Arthrobacter sp. L77]